MMGGAVDKEILVVVQRLYPSVAAQVLGEKVRLLDGRHENVGVKAKVLVKSGGAALGSSHNKEVGLLPAHARLSCTAVRLLETIIVAPSLHGRPSMPPPESRSQ